MKTSTAIKKMNPKPFPKLKKNLDDEFSIFIRTRGMDDNGITKCFTCEYYDHWKYLQCGHFILRRHMGTRFCEVNCQTQCQLCNIECRGNEEVFAERLQEKYGIGILQTLQIQKNNPVGRHEMGFLIEHYKKLNKGK